MEIQISIVNWLPLKWDYNHKKVLIMKKKNHHSKCRDIVNAASRVIIKKGVENTSLEDIANEVGMSKGALYYYYPSKNDLLLDVSEKHVKEIFYLMRSLNI